MTRVIIKRSDGAKQVFLVRETPVEIGNAIARAYTRPKDSENRPPYVNLTDEHGLLTTFQAAEITRIEPVPPTPPPNHKKSWWLG